MFTGVHPRSSNRQNGKTNPPPTGEAKLNQRQHAAARLLVLGYRGIDVAREIGVAEQTLCRWRHLPAFAAELDLQQKIAMMLRMDQMERTSLASDRRMTHD